jgi:hypothetical protein
MNKKNILIGAFLIVFFGTAYIQYKNPFPIKKSVVISTVSIKQTILIDGKKNQSPVQVKMGTTALQVLSSTHKVMANGEKENAFVTTIDGRTASGEDREFWAFYVNGKQAQVGAGSYFVKNNDTIEWKIETY